MRLLEKHAIAPSAARVCYAAAFRNERPLTKLSQLGWYADGVKTFSSESVILSALVDHAHQALCFRFLIGLSNSADEMKPGAVKMKIGFESSGMVNLRVAFVVNAQLLCAA